MKNTKNCNFHNLQFKLKNYILSIIPIGNCQIKTYQIPWFYKKNRLNNELKKINKYLKIIRFNFKTMLNSLLNKFEFQQFFLNKILKIRKACKSFLNLNTQVRWNYRKIFKFQTN